MPGNDVRIGVSADTRDAEAGADRVASKWSQAADKMGSAGRKLTRGLTLPIAGLGVAAFKMASDLDEATSQAEQVFGDSADGIIDAAGNLEDSFSEAEFLSFASTFGDIAQGMGFAQDEADDLSLSVLSLGQDLASFKNLPTEQAIHAITAAMTGEREQLKSLGIVIDEAMVKERALADRMDGTTGELTRQEKAAATLALVMEQSERAIGDFDRTSDGAANKTRIMTANFKDTAAELGQNLIPIGMQLLDWANKIATAFGKLSPTQQKLTVGAAALAAAIGPILSIGSRAVQMFRALQIAMINARIATLALSRAQMTTVVGLAATAGALAGLAIANRRMSDSDRAAAEASEEHTDRLWDIHNAAEAMIGTLDQATGQATDMTVEFIAGEFAAAGLADAMVEAGLTGDSLKTALNDIESPEALRLSMVLARGTGEEMDRASSAVLGFRSASERTEQAARILGDEVGELGESADDTADDVQSLEDAWRDLTSELLGSSDSFISAAELLDDIKDAGERVNDMTFAEALREVDNLSTEYAETIGEMVDEGRSIEDIQDFAGTARLGLLNLMMQAGFTEDQIARVVAELDRVDGKAVNASVNVRYTTSGSQFGRIPIGLGQHGGVVTRPTLAILGEAGPEEVRPLDQMPGARPLGRSSGGGMVTVPVQVVMPDGRVLAEVVAEANLEAGGEFR